MNTPLFHKTRMKGHLEYTGIDERVKLQDGHCTYNVRIMARSRNHCSSGNATMHSVCVVELHVTVNSRNILSVVQECFYCEFMSPANIKCARYFCLILTALVVSRISIQWLPRWYEDRKKDGKKLVGAFRDCANVPRNKS
jgi:hypothetical protein